jgi:hypothetical protein
MQFFSSLKQFLLDWSLGLVVYGAYWQYILSVLLELNKL